MAGAQSERHPASPAPHHRMLQLPWAQRTHMALFVSTVHERHNTSERPLRASGTVDQCACGGYLLLLRSRPLPVLELTLVQHLLPRRRRAQRGLLQVQRARVQDAGVQCRARCPAADGGMRCGRRGHTSSSGRGGGRRMFSLHFLQPPNCLFRHEALGVVSARFCCAQTARCSRCWRRPSNPNSSRMYLVHPSANNHHPLSRMFVLPLARSEKPPHRKADADPTALADGAGTAFVRRWRPDQGASACRLPRGHLAAGCRQLRGPLRGHRARAQMECWPARFQLRSTTFQHVSAGCSQPRRKTEVIRYVAVC